jgi:hypothetical protein
MDGVVQQLTAAKQLGSWSAFEKNIRDLDELRMGIVFVYLRSRSR